MAQVLQSGSKVAASRHLSQTKLSILRLSSVKERTGLSRSTLYLRIANGTFPKPIALGGRAVGWLESEVADWIAARVAERGPSPGVIGSDSK